MATASTSQENRLVIEVGKLHPDYTIRLQHPIDRVYPQLYVTNGKYEVGIEIRLAKHHWDVQVLDRLVVKAIKQIESISN